VVAFSATYAIGVCLFELVTGRHPGLLGIAIPAAGTLSGIGAVRVSKRQRGKSGARQRTTTTNLITMQARVSRRTS
jgi:hypothetical protein